MIGREVDIDGRRGEQGTGTIGCQINKDVARAAVDVDRPRIRGGLLSTIVPVPLVLKPITFGSATASLSCRRQLAGRTFPRAPRSAGRPAPWRRRFATSCPPWKPTTWPLTAVKSCPEVAVPEAVETTAGDGGLRGHSTYVRIDNVLQIDVEN